MTEYRIISPGVLAEFRARGDQPEFWAHRWRDTEYLEFLARYERGRLDQFDRVFKKHLPKGGRVIEAGCGRGQYVAALRALGYDAIGIDFAEPLVAGIKRAKPSLPVEVGDVRALPFPDGNFDAYISLGVVEHFWEGPELILAEARRVLKSGGLIIISVPYFGPHFRRRAERTFQRYTGELRDSFYQYYFSRDVFAKHIAKSDFEVVETYFYDALYGAKRAYPLFAKLHSSSFIMRYGVHQLLKLGVPQALQAKFGHMQMIIGRARPIA
jgi:SAM-dependent methyltransferase